MKTQARMAMAGLAAASLAAAATPAAAADDIVSLEMFRSLASQQMGDGASLVDVGVFLSIGAHTGGTAVYGSASVDMPGPSSQPLLMASPIFYAYQTPTLPSKAAMDAAFPAGTYQVNLDAGSGPVSASFDLGADHYASSQPYLAGASWSALQGMNAAAPMTLQFSAFATDPAATDSFLFFTVYDRTASQNVVDIGFQPALTTGITLPAGTLAAGHLFGYELIFSSRVTVPSPGAQFDAQIGFDRRTEGEFATAVPEPASLALWLAGLGLVGVRTRRRPGAASPR